MAGIVRRQREACHRGKVKPRRGILRAMALPHARPGDVVDVGPAPSTDQGPRAAAIFKSRDLEVIRLELKAGEALPPHKVAGEITVQCLRGVLELGFDGRTCRLRAGEMTYLLGGAMHAVVGVEDCSALVTIAL